jgi:hypothetical protein
VDVTLAEFQSIHNEIIILNVKCVRAQGASKRKRVLYFDFESSLLYHCPLGFFSDPVFFSKGGNQSKARLERCLSQSPNRPTQPEFI